MARSKKPEVKTVYVISKQIQYVIISCAEAGRPCAANAEGNVGPHLSDQRQDGGEHRILDHMDKLHADLRVAVAGLEHHFCSLFAALDLPLTESPRFAEQADVLEKGSKEEKEEEDFAETAAVPYVFNPAAASPSSSRPASDVASEPSEDPIACFDTDLLSLGSKYHRDGNGTPRDGCGGLDDPFGKEYEYDAKQTDPASNAMITIRPLADPVIKDASTLGVRSSDTGRMIKVRIQVEYGIPASRQLLFDPGNAASFPDDLSLESASLQAGALLLFSTRDDDGSEV